jgi:hypothetical protein
MPAHEPPTLEDEGTAAPTTDAPTEPPAVAAPRFAPRTPEELARAAIVRELRELEKQSPPFDSAQQNADWQWLFSEYAKRAGGALGPYAGQFVAVLRARVIGSGDSCLQLQLDVWKLVDPPVHPEQFVIFYIDPWEGIPWESYSG